MDKLSARDVEILFVGSVVSYKGIVASVEFIDVGRDESISVFIKTHLKNKATSVPFSLDHFKPCNGRLGFVNREGTVLLIKRSPVRRFSVGLTPHNTRMKSVAYLRNSSAEQIGEYQDRLFRTKHKLFLSKEFNDCVNGVYPSFKECVKTLLKNKDTYNIIAFDRQFAIDTNGNLFYEDKIIGKCQLDIAKSEDDLEYQEEYKYLSTLVKGKHEKDFRNFSPL